MFVNSDELEVKCNRCRVLKMAKKTVTLQGCPPVLILHLKRFKVTPYQTLKMQNMINFPLYDLDMASHCSFIQPE
jgi:uncharacterized UBP type Zn finger protein